MARSRFQVAKELADGSLEPLSRRTWPGGPPEEAWVDVLQVLADDPVVTDTLSIPDTRVEPPSGLDERTTLIEFLDSYRETVLVKLDGLDRAALTRRLVPSHTTLLGIVRHLIQVEVWWFVTVFGGEQVDPAEEDYDPNSDWVIADDDTPEALVAAYRAACARGNEIARAAPSLDDRSPGPGKPGTTMRWILVHMIDETARHAGHADILRELIDGRTGD